MLLSSLSLVRYCVSFGSVIQNLRHKPRCDFECCLLVALMMNGASADFSGLEHGETLSCHVMPEETFQAAGVTSVLDETGLMDIEMYQTENTTETAIQLDRDEDKL